jgi:hypothetical protein
MSNQLGGTGEVFLVGNGGHHTWEATFTDWPGCVLMQPQAVSYSDKSASNQRINYDLGSVFFQLEEGDNPATYTWQAVFHNPGPAKVNYYVQVSWS